MSSAVATKPPKPPKPEVTPPEESARMRKWKASKDERNEYLPKGWRFIELGEVTDGHRSVFLTNALAHKTDPKLLKMHIEGVLSRQQRISGDDGEDQQ